MKDYSGLIVEYELSRKVMQKLKTTYVKKFDCVNFLDDPLFRTCKELAFNSVKKDSKCDDYNPCTDYSLKQEFKAKLDDIGCDACKLSYKFKIGPVAEAKQRFGRAKTALSVAARSITMGVISDAAQKEVSKIISEL